MRLPKLICAWLVLGLAAFAQTAVTVTAVHETMEVGQQVPPMIFKWSTQPAANSCTGHPTITTTATSSSAAGNYPISISAGTLVCTGYTLTFVNGTMAVIPFDGMGAQINNSVSYPSGFKSGGTPNAVIDFASNSICNVTYGITDDPTTVTNNTTCSNQILSHWMNGNCATQPTQVLYALIQGWISVNGQINPCGNGWTFFGIGPQQSGFRLVPNTMNTGTNTQFFNPSSVSSASNFREFIYNLGFDVSYGNPNAIPVTSEMNNVGALRNVVIWVEDTTCPEAFNLSRAYPGPALSKNMAMYGCAIGVYSNLNEYNWVFDQVTMEGQTAEAMMSTASHWSLEHWLSDNTVSAYVGGSVGGAGTIAILNSELLNGASGTTALRQLNANGILYERNVTTTGYGTAMTDSNGSITNTAMPAEYYTGTAQCLFCGQTRKPRATPTGVYVNWTVTPPTGSQLPAVSANIYRAQGTSCSTLSYSQIANGTPVNGPYFDALANLTRTQSYCYYVAMVNSKGEESTETTTPVYSAVTIPAITTPHSLNLPQAETPPPADDPNMANWTQLPVSAATWASVIAGSTSATVYSPPGTITGTGTYNITVPDTVNHLNFYNGIDVSQSPKFIFTVAGSSSTPLTITGCIYAVCNVVHTGTRTLVIKDTYMNGYQASPGAGNVFFEDSITNGGSVLTPPQFYSSQNLWARQFNIEAKEQAYQFNCQAATMWMLGYKTENDATVGNPSVQATGCKIEIFGYFYYPLVQGSTNTTANILTNSSIWATAGTTFVTCGANTGCGWQYQWNETQGPTTLSIAAPSQTASVFTNVYYSYGAEYTAPPTPTPSAPGNVLMKGRFTGQVSH